MTAQIASTIQDALQPKESHSVDAAHQCMTTRGVHKPGVSMVTTRFTGTCNGVDAKSFSNEIK